MQVSGIDVMEEARKWKGVRWHHQGRVRAGIDCAGLLIRVMGDLGLPVEDMQGYRRSPDSHAFLEHIRRQTDLGNAPLPGSIGLFRQSRFPCHVGFFGERDGKVTLIHAYTGAGKVIEEVYDHEWVDLLVEIRFIKGLNY